MHNSVMNERNFKSCFKEQWAFPIIKRAWSPKMFLGASLPDPLLTCPEHKSDFGLDPLLITAKY